MGKLWILIALVCFNAHAITLNFGRTENVVVSQKRFNKVLLEFKEITDLCCSLYKRNCNENQDQIKNSQLKNSIEPNYRNNYMFLLWVFYI